MPDPKPRANPERDRRRRAFLRALAAGQSVVAAADTAGIGWSTLYAWRRDAPKFRAAWDRAAELARGALADRFQAALIQRAVDGVDEPVFHAGRIVGTRKQYSDTLLLAGLREMMKPQVAAPGADPAQPKVQVVIRQLGEHGTRQTPPPRAARDTKPVAVAGPVLPEPAAAEPAAPPILPDPANAPALCWDHLGRREPEGLW